MYNSIIYIPFLKWLNYRDEGQITEMKVASSWEWLGERSGYGYKGLA